MNNLQCIRAGNQLLLFAFISNIVIVLFIIAGCSDPSHTRSIVSNTGSMVAHPDVDDYLTTIRGGRYCIHNDSDSSCIDLIPLVNGNLNTNGPIIHIYPERTLYLFYHEGNPILRAERIGDTTEFVETLGDSDNNGTNGTNGNGTDGTNGTNGNGTNGTNGNGTDGTNGPNGNDNNDDDPESTDPADKTSDGHGWLIWIYYPEGAAPINPPTLSESHVIVTINGKQLTDEDITGFAQFMGTEGERGIQFFYPTDTAELLDLQVQIIGITDREGDVRFNINYIWYSD